MFFPSTPMLSDSSWISLSGYVIIWVMAASGTILIVDDEPEWGIMRAVVREIEASGWRPAFLDQGGGLQTGEDFEASALYAVEQHRPVGVLLDVRFGDHADDLFAGLAILRTIVARHPALPVLMFTQYARGPERERAAHSSLRWDAPVDFIDKLASPQEVVMRLRRLIGAQGATLAIGTRIRLDPASQTASAEHEGTWRPVAGLIGMRFGILLELASSWYKNPGQVVRFASLERYSEGEDARASLRVRVREIKDALGAALGMHLGPNDLIVNVRDQGYRISPLPNLGM